MKIRFKNGSTTETIESSESKRGRGHRSLINPIDDCCDCIRGRRLTDEESKRFMYKKSVNTEYNVDKAIKKLESIVENNQLNCLNYQPEMDGIYFKLACFYKAETELYDRSLTDLRDRYDPTSAFITGENRKYSNAYSFKLYKWIISFGERALGIPNNVFIPNFRKHLSRGRLSAQGWIDIYDHLVEEGEMDFIHKEWIDI